MVRKMALRGENEPVTDRGLSSHMPSITRSVFLSLRHDGFMFWYNLLGLHVVTEAFYPYRVYSTNTEGMISMPHLQCNQPEKHG